MPKVRSVQSPRTEKTMEKWDLEILLSGVDNQWEIWQMMGSGWASGMTAAMRKLTSVPCPT